MGELAHLLTDWPHLVFEVITTIVFEVFGALVLWPLVRWAIRREHRVIDREHGVDHVTAAVQQHPHRLRPLAGGAALTEDAARGIAREGGEGSRRRTAAAT